MTLKSGYLKVSSRSILMPTPIALYPTKFAILYQTVDRQRHPTQAQYTHARPAFRQLQL